MTKSDIKKIQKEFRRSDEARYIHRLHGVLLVLSGLSSVKAAALLNEPQRTVAEWVKRYRQSGLEGLWNAEKSGRPKVLNPRQESTLLKAVQRSPMDSGFESEHWTGELVSEYVKKHFNLQITVRHARRLLRSMEK